MSAQIIDGKALAAETRASLAKRVTALQEQGLQPGLAVVLVGEDPASQVYVRNKVRSCKEVGIDSREIQLPADTDTLLETVTGLATDDGVHGMLVQLPLPDMIKPGAVVIDVGINRDADGKLCGDVDFDDCRSAAGWITPVPGGVGPMTITMLLANTLEAAERELA